MRSIPAALKRRSLLFLFIALLCASCAHRQELADPTRDLARQSMVRIQELFNQNNCQGMFTPAVLAAVDNATIKDSCQELRRAAGEWRNFTVTSAELISTSAAPLSILSVRGTAAFEQGTYNVLGYWDPGGHALQFFRVDDGARGTIVTFPTKTKFVFRSKGQ
jgi:hypothetical protein